MYKIHITFETRRWRNQPGSYYESIAVRDSLVICEMGIKLTFQRCGDQMRHWVCDLCWSGSYLSLALVEPRTPDFSLFLMVERELRELPFVSKNKSRKLRGRCYCLLSNAMSFAYCALSHGPCTFLTASLLLVGWNSQGNKAPLIFLESLVSCGPTMFATKLWRRSFFSCSFINPKIWKNAL